MIKVLLVIPTLDQSGAEKQFGLLASRLPRDRFDVRVAALSRGGPFERLLREANVPVSVLGKRWRFDPIVIAKLRRLVRRWRPDIVLSGLFAANSAARLATLAVDPRPALIASERCVDTWKSSWQLALDRLLQSRTDVLVANSESVGDFYAQHGFPRDKLEVIPNGVEPPPWPAIDRAELCRQWSLPEDAQLIAFVGRLAPQKRLKDLLWAAQILRQADDRARFLLIGDGPQRAELELYAEDIEVSPFVRFLGHRPDASSLLHLMDVFWLGSEFEGMSNSLMEAMSCGKPVVVSDIPANRELVRHGQEGWIVNLGDSPGFAQFTLRLMQDVDVAEQMGRAGRARMAREFSLERMVQRYAELLEDQVRRRRAPIAAPPASAPNG